MCTALKGKGSWFLPFNKGYNDGAGNPPNPHGLKTDYLWKEALTHRIATSQASFRESQSMCHGVLG